MYLIQKRENILKTLENKNPEHPPDAPFFQNGVGDLKHKKVSCQPPSVRLRMTYVICHNSKIKNVNEMCIFDISSYT
ncbi:hypothetical protein C5S42_01165 [Candidatus Methanomarinus sp.]|nr:hypothetical protein C5S42_01165 [ANME-2 cluster archaeon]